MSDISFNSLVNLFSSNFRWPDSKQSVGKLLQTKGQKKCWEAVGPARAAFLTLGPEITDYLDNTTETRPGSETVTFSIYMIGRNKSRAAPTLLFCSEDYRSRKIVHDAVKQSGLMERYPGIKTGNAPRAPEIESHGPLQPLALDTMPLRNAQTSGPSDMCTVIHVSNNKIFAPHHLGKQSRAHIATLGGIARCNDKTFLLTAGHPFETADLFDRTNKSLSDDDGWELDSDHGSDVTDFGEYMEGGSTNDEHITNQTGLTQILCEEGESGATTIISDPSETLLTSDSSESSTTVECRIDALSSSFDYALIRVSASDPLVFGEAAESTRSLSNWHLVYSIPVGVQDSKIVSYVASSGCLTGMLNATPTYIRMPNGKRFQRTYRVDFDAPIYKGDCGSWVLDAETRGFYGHIIAGCERSTVAYIIPSIDVLNDAQKQLSKSLQLYCHRTMQTKESRIRDPLCSPNSEVKESSLQNFAQRIRSPTGPMDAVDDGNSLGPLLRVEAAPLKSEKMSIPKWQQSFGRRYAHQKTNSSVPVLDYIDSPKGEDFIRCLLRDDIGRAISPEADAVERFCRGASLTALQEDKGAGMTIVAIFDQRSFDDAENRDHTNFGPLTAWGLYRVLKDRVSTLKIMA
jgi:hypothetical protein